MKLIYIANIRVPTEKAHGIQIMKMCEAFSNQGLKLKLVLPWRFNKIKKDVFDFYGVKRNFKIKKVFSLDLIFLRIPKFGFWIQSLTFSISAFIYLIFKKTDIIYSRDPFILYLISFFKKNFVLELHYIPKNSFLYNRVFKKSKNIIVITKNLKNELIKKGILENKILIAPDGVDLEKFDINISKEEAREKLNLPLDKKIVLYTGHLYEWKGAQILADASKSLDNNTLIIFVGGTENNIKKFKNRNIDKNNLLILGYKPYSQIPYYLKASDILVLPNSGKTEISKDWTSPMKMFEYMVSKRPIIASDLPSIREILNENNAILVKSDNSDELANSINMALKNQTFSDKISIQSYQDVQKYSWFKRSKKIIHFLNND